MSRRKSKKSRSKRGSRTHGGGKGRNRRHSGNKGGKGLAGSHKHRWMEVQRNMPKHFGKYGFKRPSNLQEETKTVNVGELDEYVDELVEEDLVEEEGDEIVIDASELNFDKVLGGGQVNHQLRVIADDFSKSAERKLEKSGGAAVKGES